jgi:RNA polymerase sigma factor (sigma-70 family)
MRKATVAGSVPVPGSTMGDLFRTHYLGLVRLAVLMVGDQATAEDVVQDVFTRLHARWDRIEIGDVPLISYVRAAVINGCRTALRHRSVVRRVAAAQDTLASRQILDSAETEAIAADDRRQLLAALARLPRRRVAGRPDEARRAAQHPQPVLDRFRVPGVPRAVVLAAWLSGTLLRPSRGGSVAATTRRR